VSRLGFYTLAALTVYLLIAFSLGPIHIGPIKSPHSATLQAVHTLTLAAFQYANDFDQHYPDGKSSTEICQKLLDGKYVSDPAIFYVPLPGKVKARAGQPLKPENVCWDFTGRVGNSGLDSSDPDTIPVVYLTGFRMSYTRGGNAVPLIKPYSISVPDGEGWFSASRQTYSGPSGLAVAYKSNSTKFISLDDKGIVPNVLPSEFEDNDARYHQLTPNGALP